MIWWAGRSPEPWAPPSLNQGGIGGSETATIYLARLFAQAGWRVDIFSSPDYLEGRYEGVGYWDTKRYVPDTKCDVFVSWRDPGAWTVPVQAAVKVIHCHDHHYGPDAGPHLARFDKVLGVSQTHADFLREAYGLTNVDYVPNGIDLARFDLPDVKKKPFQCVWSSSPDRDLDLMLILWPRILAVEPEATLHVAYGWQGIDARIRAGDQMAGALKQKLEQKLATLKGVFWHGRIGQDALARMKCESWCSPYPSAFYEVSCISMMEAQAAGAVPVVCDTGALKETVGDGGYIVPGNPYSKVTQDMFLRVCHAVLGEVNARKVKEAAGRERAQGFTWQKSVDEHWMPKVVAMLEGAKIAVPA